MPTVTTTDGTSIYYRDWGTGQPIVFSHGWPLTGAAWEAQMLFFNAQGYRTIAHDRRGNGYSDQPGFGNDVDTWADDLNDLITALDLHNVVLVGHSTGGGELARYISRHVSAGQNGPSGLDCSQHVAERHQPQRRAHCGDRRHPRRGGN